MRTFTHKGYGRIYCETKEDVPKVESVIQGIDEYEFNGYFPTGLVAPFSEYPRVIYLHKFSDMNTDEITAKCWAAGIKVWIFDTGHEEHPRSAIAKVEP